MILYVDLDEVFFDFIGGACSLFDVDKDEVLEHRRQTKTWNMIGAVNALGKTKHTVNSFWSTVISQGSIFWEELEPLPWAFDLLKILHTQPRQWYLLSSPADSPVVYTGKLKAIKSFFGETFGDYILTPHKQLLAQPGTCLIDDNPVNVETFIYRPHGAGKLVSSGAKAHLFGTSPTMSKRQNENPLPAFQTFLEHLEV